MKKKEYLAYWLVNDGYVNETYPGLINITKLDEPNFDEKKLAFGRGRLSSIWPENVKINVSGDEPVDLLFCTPYIKAVSDRAKSIISDYAKEDVEFLPIQILKEDGSPYTRTNYWAINILTVVDALDWANTTWTTPLPPAKDDPFITSRIIKPCLYADKIVGANFFRLEVAEKISSLKYLSLLMKKELEKSGYTIGMKFAPVKTTYKLN